MNEQLLLGLIGFIGFSTIFFGIFYCCVEYGFTRNLNYYSMTKSEKETFHKLSYKEQKKILNKGMFK